MYITSQILTTLPDDELMEQSTFGRDMLFLLRAGEIHLPPEDVISLKMSDELCEREYVQRLAARGELDHSSEIFPL